jgi:amino acid transporter/nucleotide-binding universal stress UspA family protein
MLFGDWGTSRLYVLGLALFYTGRASFWFMLAMSFLLVAVGWAYQIICRLYPDGGGVYSSARHRSELLAVVGALLLCADYVVTAALSALDAFHYVGLANAEWWAAGSVALIGVVNYFGPTKAGTGALVVAMLTILFSLIIAGEAAPHLATAHITAPQGNALQWWGQFTALILAISGVEAVANMTGIMVKPVEKTARRAIWPVLIEIVTLNMVLTVAMLAIPAETLGDGDAAQAFTAHRDTMLRLLAEYYVGPMFAAVASLVFALLLLSAVNTAVTDLVSIQFMMARDDELPRPFGGLNRWGMPFAPLVIGTLIPILTVIAVPDVGRLADLYAIGVVGAVAVNLGSCSTNFAIALRRHERIGMLLLTVLMVLIWLTIAWEKPLALLFAMSIMGAGLCGRWAAHNRDAIRDWMLAPLETPFAAEPEVNIAPPIRVAPTAVPKPARAATPSRHRLMVASRGNPKLLNFAIEEAKAKHAELLVLFVRHIAVPTMGPSSFGDVTRDAEAKDVFSAARQAAEAAEIPVFTLYSVAFDVAEAILETAATHAVDTLLLGSTQRGALWKTMKGDVISEVAEHLPERINLLIHG